MSSTRGGLHSRPGLKFDFSTLHSTQPRFTLVFREPTFISTRGEFNPELSTSDSHCTRCGRLRCNVYVMSTWLLQVLFRLNRSFFCCFTCFCEDAEVAKMNPCNTGICSRQGGRYVMSQRRQRRAFLHARVQLYIQCTFTCKPTRVHAVRVQ